MTTKLNWEYDDQMGGYIAFHNGHRIRAVYDERPENPFEAWACNWPIAVWSDNGLACYEHPEDFTAMGFFERVGDAELIHMQVHVAKALDTTVLQAMESYVDRYAEQGCIWSPAAYITNTNALRDIFSEALDDLSARECMSKLVELYKLFDIPAYLGQAHGCCQGDWAEVLVVACKRTQKRFGTVDPPKPKDLKDTVDLYEAWAFGQVYGYIVEEAVRLSDDEDDDDIEWQEIEDGSCWGFYGSDFDKSGLEEAALECIPKKELCDAVS